MTSFNVQWFPARVFMKTSLFPSISKSWLLARYTFSKFSDLKFGNSSLFGDEWKDAPESKIQDSVGLSTLRIRESPMFYVEFVESSSSSNLWFCFLFGLVQSVQVTFFSTIPISYVLSIWKIFMVVWFLSIFVWALQFTSSPLVNTKSTTR